MNITEKLASEGHLTDEQVERIGRNVHDFMEAVEKDPALYKEALEKVAGLGDILRNAFSEPNIRAGTETAVRYVPQMLAASGVGAVLGGGIEAGRSGVRALKDMYDKRQAYKSMLEENPQLANADPRITEKAFNTIYRFNPAYAKDPLVAGTFVKNVIDQERMDIGSVSNLVQANKFINEAKGKGPKMTDFFMEAMQKAPDQAMKEETQGWNRARAEREKTTWDREELERENRIAAEAAEAAMRAP